MTSQADLKQLDPDQLRTVAAQLLQQVQSKDQELGRKERELGQKDQEIDRQAQQSPCSPKRYVTRQPSMTS